MSILFTPKHQEAEDERTIAKTLEHIKKNGLQIGNRWKIAQEKTETSEPLMFRDCVSGKHISFEG
jgi:hypothetical protein